MYLIFQISSDKADGELREVICQKVGGEFILQKMLDDRKAVAYIHNGAQFVRLVRHAWSDTHTLSNGYDIGGRSGGAQALDGGITLEGIADFFSNTLEDAHQSRNEILDLGDTRMLQAHACGLSMMRQSQQLHQQVTPGQAAILPGGDSNGSCG